MSDTSKATATRTVTLPAGHDWHEFDTNMAQWFGWYCAVCGAEFTDDAESEEPHYEEGGPEHDDE